MKTCNSVHECFPPYSAHVQSVDILTLCRHKTIILSVVLYGCETWSLTLREECRLRVFENRMLKRKFGTKRDEVTGEWRKLHNEELTNPYSSPNIFR
jgi:hypothetical protein